jgi:hypothetical protein
VVSEIKEKLYKGDLSPLFSLLQKRSNWRSNWYCNLRKPAKATSLGYLRDTEAKPQYKEI